VTLQAGRHCASDPWIFDNLIDIGPCGHGFVAVSSQKDGFSPIADRI
jgi:hypothetical protein